MRSPTGPPRKVPAAIAARKMKRCNCASGTERLNFSMRKNV
jgi:hypothetical protein